jgi:regulation of enolase protein 1 (concanavalin A-like superfamily)
LWVIAALGCGKSAPAGGGDPVDAAVVDARVADASADLVRRDVAPAPAAPPSGPLAPWSAVDLGPPGSFKAEVRATMTLVSVRAAGLDIGGVADSGHFLAQKVQGDFELVARIRSLQMVAPDSKAGLMVRVGETDPAAASFFLAVLGDPARGGQLQVRTSAGAAATVFGPDPGVRAGQWLRIIRRGRTFTAARSSSRLDWIKVGSADLDLPAELSVGIAVASRNATRATTAEIDGLRVSSLAGQPATRNWMIDEIATLGGSATWSGGGLTVAGLGEPLSLLMESGVLVFDSVSGNQVLTARVASFSHTDPAARVSLMIRQGPPVVFARTQPAVLLSLTAGMGLQFQSRASINLMATVAPPRAEIKAPVWLRLERVEEAGPPLASRFLGSYSLDGRQWVVVGEATFAMPEPFLMGIAAGSNGSSTPVTATFTDLALTAGAPPAPPPAPDARPADAADGGS